MLTLAAGDTLAGVASAASKVTCTIFGMELVTTTESYKVLDQRQLPNAAATIYTVPASNMGFVKAIHVVNTDTVTQTFQLFRGGTAAANAITPVVTLPIGGMAIYEDGQGWTVYDSTGRVQSQGLTISSATPAVTDASAGAAGAALQVSAADHDHQLSVATNALLLGTAAAAGAATSTLRSNDTIAAFDATVPAAIGVAATGSVAFAARRDHVHPDVHNASTAAVAGGYAADTYLAGSSVTVAAGAWAAKTIYRCVFDMVKTAAGTAAFTIIVRMGTAGTTSDTAILTLAYAVGTAAIDTGLFEVRVNFRTVGAGTAAVIQGVVEVNHHLAATGLVTTGASGTGIILGTSAGFNSTTPTILGLSVNGGASFAGTNTLVRAELSL